MLIKSAVRKQDLTSKPPPPTATNAVNYLEEEAQVYLALRYNMFCSQHYLLSEPGGWFHYIY